MLFRSRRLFGPAWRIEDFRRGFFGDAEVLVPAMKDLKRLQKTLYENLQSAMLAQKDVDRALQDAARIWNEGG